MHRQLAALTVMLLLGLVFLCTAIGFTCFVPIGHTIQCVKATQTCEFKKIYVWPKNERQLFDFADVVNIKNVNWGTSRYGQKLYALQIDLEYTIQIVQAHRFSLKRTFPYKVKSAIFIPMPSGYLSDKEVTRLKAYLKDQKQEELVIQHLPISVLFVPVVFLLSGLLLLSFPFSIQKKRPRLLKQAFCFDLR